MISKAIAELPVPMKNMNCFLSNDQKQKQLNSAYDQHRNASAFHNIAAKDYNKDLLDEAMYHAQPGAVGAVSNIHSQHVKDMLEQKKAKLDLDRCKRRLDEEKAAEEDVEEDDEDSSSISSSSSSSHQDSISENEEKGEYDWTGNPADDYVRELVSGLKSSHDE